MKKFYLAAITAMAIAGGAMPVQAVEFQDAVVINSTPEGTFYEMERSCSAYSMQWGFSIMMDYNSLVGRVVVSDDAVYMYNPCSQYDTRTWLKGSLAADGKVTVELPQCVVKDADTTDPAAWQLFFAYKMHEVLDDEGYFVCEAEETGTIEFMWKDGKLTQTSEGFIGLCRDGGEWLGYADTDAKYKPFKEVAPAPADPAKLNLEDFAMTYTNSYEENLTRMVKGAFDGNDFWLRGVWDRKPDWWVKGTRDGDKVTFKTQFMGPDIEYTGYYIYFVTAKEWEDSDPDTAPSDGWYTATKELVFDYDEATGKLTTDGAILINAGKTDVYYVDEILAPALQPFTTKPAVPADPVFKNYIAFMPLFGDGFVSWYIPCTDTEGNFLNPEYLFWRIYVDDATEPYELCAEDYPNLTEDITDIPWTMSFDYGGPVYANGDVHEFMFLFEGARGIGAQSVYRGGGEEHCSKIVYWGKAPDSGIVDAGMSVETGAKELYDLSGRKVSNPGTGLYIERTVLSDGTLISSKKLVK